MTAPATLRYPHRDIKLLFVSDNENKCTYWLKPALWRGPFKLADLVRQFRPGCKIPDDPIYWQVYRRVKRLAALGYVRLEKRERVDWQATIDQRMDEIEQSVHNIFVSAVQGLPPRTVSSGTPSTGADPQISTVKIQETGFSVVPTEQLFTLLCRVQNSNRFLDPAKVRTESGQLRQSLADQKVQRRKKCPYYLGARTRGIRIDAVFRLRTVRRHSYFRRRDKKFVNPELVTDLNFVQDRFDEYADQVRDLKCALVHKEDGSIKLIDYQTRFTDESRQDQTIARFHHSWEKASQTFNTAVFLTLTSYPPSEAPKQHYRQSLWHVDRHYAVAWNAYMSKLEKRERDRKSVV